VGYLSGWRFIENAPYTTLKVHKNFEVRRYAPSVAAEYIVEDAGMREAGNKGFRPLAGFIFGGNHGPDAQDTAPRGAAQSISMTAPVTVAPRGAAQSISMTAPVTATPVRGGAVSVTFTMPRKFRSIADLPAPNNANVKLKEVPSSLQAARRVSVWRIGRSLLSEEVFAEEVRALEADVRAAGLVPLPPAADGTGGAAQHGYDPPWTPWFMKRVEVTLALREA
jgi:hypothetical protein